MRKRAGKVWTSPERDKLITAIAERRKKLGMSQRELSRRLELHPMTVCRMENGQRGIDVAELIKIAEILNVDPVELFQTALTSD